MTKQLAIEGTAEGVLPDGTIIKEGDIIMTKIAMYTGFTRVVMFDGELCMEENFMYGKNTSISHFLKQANYNCVKKVSLCDVYMFCKKHHWDTAKYIIKFSKR